MTPDPGTHPQLSMIIGGWSRSPARRGAGGGNDGYEGRIARLEASVSHLEKDMQEVRSDIREIRTDMRDVRERLTKLEVRVDHLPGKGFIVTSVVVTLALLTSAITFQDRIQRLVRGTPPVAASMSSPTPIAP